MLHVSQEAYPAACAAAPRRFCGFIRRQSGGCSRPRPGASGRQRVRGSPPDREAFPEPGQRTRRGGRMMGNPGIHARRPRPQLRPSFSHRCSGGDAAAQAAGCASWDTCSKRSFANVHSMCFTELFAGLSPGLFRNTSFYHAFTRVSPGFNKLSPSVYQVFARVNQGLPGFSSSHQA